MNSVDHPASRTASSTSLPLLVRFGLVALIASGYRWLAVAMLTIYVVPLVTWGLWRILRGDSQTVGAIEPRAM